MEKEQTNIIDEGLFEKIANGDDAAFTELYYASYRQIYGFLLALTKNKEDAEDLLQNTYKNKKWKSFVQKTGHTYDLDVCGGEESVLGFCKKEIQRCKR